MSGRAADPEMVGEGQTELQTRGREGSGMDWVVGGGRGERLGRRYGGGEEAGSDGVGIWV